MAEYNSQALTQLAQDYCQAPAPDQAEIASYIRELLANPTVSNSVGVKLIAAILTLEEYVIKKATKDRVVRLDVVLDIYEVEFKKIFNANFAIKGLHLEFLEQLCQAFSEKADTSRENDFFSKALIALERFVIHQQSLHPPVLDRMDRVRIEAERNTQRKIAAENLRHIRAQLDVAQRNKYLLAAATSVLAIVAFFITVALLLHLIVPGLSLGIAATPVVGVAASLISFIVCVTNIFLFVVAVYAGQSHLSLKVGAQHIGQVLIKALTASVQKPSEPAVTLSPASKLSEMGRQATATASKTPVGHCVVHEAVPPSPRNR